MRQSCFVSRRADWAWLSLLPCWAIASPPEDPSPSSDGKRGDPLTAVVQYSAPSRTEPRPLQMHVLRIDLQAAGFEMAVAVGDDPDGDGPAEAQLTSPRVMATRAGFAAAVNTNPWVMVPATLHGHRTPYVAGGGCDVSGWAVCDGRQRSEPQAGHWAFWLDDQRRAQLDAQPRHLGALVARVGLAHEHRSHRREAALGQFLVQLQVPAQAAGADCHHGIADPCARHQGADAPELLQLEAAGLEGEDVVPGLGGAAGSKRPTG